MGPACATPSRRSPISRPAISTALDPVAHDSTNSQPVVGEPRQPPPIMGHEELRPAGTRNLADGAYHQLRRRQGKLNAASIHLGAADELGAGRGAAGGREFPDQTTEEAADALEAVPEGARVTDNRGGAGRTDRDAGEPRIAKERREQVKIAEAQHVAVRRGQ